MPKYPEYPEVTSLKSTDLLLAAIDNGDATYTTKKLQAGNLPSDGNMEIVNLMIRNGANDWN